MGADMSWRGFARKACVIEKIIAPLKVPAKE